MASHFHLTKQNITLEKNINNIVTCTLRCIRKKCFHCFLINQWFIFLKSVAKNLTYTVIKQHCIKRSVVKIPKITSLNFCGFDFY